MERGGGRQARIRAGAAVLLVAVLTAPGAAAVAGPVPERAGRAADAPVARILSPSPAWLAGVVGTPATGPCLTEEAESATAPEPVPGLGRAERVALAPVVRAESSPAKSLSPQAQAAAAAIGPAVVDIDSTVGFAGGSAAGTGIVLSADALVLTSHHVVAGATAIAATDVGTGGRFSAEVLGYDVAEDIAVLRLVGASGLPSAAVADSSAVPIGATVVAVGNAGGLGGQPTSVEGQLVARNRSISVSDPTDGSIDRLRHLLEVSAPLEPGQSGGPLVDLTGSVLGVNEAASFSDSGRSTGGWAVPINRAMAIVRTVLAGSEAGGVHLGPPAFLGITLSRGTTTATIAGVLPESAALAAGLEVGDRITRLGSHRIRRAEQVVARISALHPGDRVKVRWTRPDGSTHSAWVTLGTGPMA